MALGTWTTHNANSSFNVTIPSGSNRVAKLFVGFEFSTTPPTSVTATVGGVSMVSAGTPSRSTIEAGGADAMVYAFYLLDASFPATGTRAVAVTITGGTSVQGHRRAFAVDDNRKQEAPQFISAGNSSASTTRALGPLNTLNDSYGSAAVQTTSSAVTQTIGGSWTERWDAGDVGGDASQAGGDITYSGTGTDTVTFTASVSARLAGTFLVLAPYVAGPTIDTQPTAQTARLNGDATTTATFTVAATTSGGSLTYDWELETSVGGGSYSNLADGNGATWTGQASASCVGTFTAKTLSGRRVRCNVTDSNGTTTTDAVTLTVLDGPVLSASTATTNGSGVASVTMTSDDALSANGEILLVTATVRGQVVARTTVRPA